MRLHPQILRLIGSVPFMLLLLAGYPSHLQAQVRLTASDGIANDYFGYFVSQSGTIGLVGAYGKNTSTGAAYVFRSLDTASGTVTQNVKLTASDGVANDYFGISVSQSGTIGLVGAQAKNSNQGAAYVFRGLDTATGTVNQNVKLTASDGGANDYFGLSVSQSSTTGLVGAPGKNSFQGAAYLFRGLDIASGTVNQNVKLTSSDGVANDYFGYSVSQSSTTGLVGAPEKNSNQGAAYVFRNLNTATGTVTQNVKLTASDGVATDQLGISVSLSGTIGLVGANGKNSNQGAAYVFRGLDTATGTANQNVKLIASDGATNDDFGQSVSLSGTIGLVGANSKNSNQGAAYVFRGLDTATGTAIQNVKLTASDSAANDFFGISVSLSGDQFTIGAEGKNSGTGKAYTGTVSSVTTLDLGSTSKPIDGISFVSQDNWIIGQNTSANQVTLNAGNTANVTASGKVVYIGQNAGSYNNTLVISGTLTASQITIGATGNTGNVLQVNTVGTVAASAITVNTGGTLAGTGTVTGATTVASNGTIRGGTGINTGTLTAGNITLQSGGNIFTNLAASGTSSRLGLGGQHARSENRLDPEAHECLRL